MFIKLLSEIVACILHLYIAQKMLF